MKIYLVGGAVRDKLLGLPVKEKDWVVVGATVNDMLKQGYKQVGKEFPVFLHPKTGEEYALARMERKVKPGYQGFTFDTSPEVSLEEDLIRRDLTINAMAEAADGQLIDPYGGKPDLENKLLKHVSDAFAEDPVRILRIGRFLARYAALGFHVAPETVQLMRKMVESGEVNALVAERVWKELERALGEKNPEKFFEVLAECGALPILFPHLQIAGPGMKALKVAAELTEDPSIRFAALLYALPEENSDKSEGKKYVAELCNRYRAPNAYRELAQLSAAFCEKVFLLNNEHLFFIKKMPSMTSTLSNLNSFAEALLQIFSALDIYRREDRFQKFLLVCRAVAQSQNRSFDADWLLEGAQVAKSVDVQELIAQGFDGQTLAIKLKEKRQEMIVKWLDNH